MARASNFSGYATGLWYGVKMEKSSGIIKGRFYVTCHATDGPPGPSTANFVAIVGPPGLTMAAMDGPPGLSRLSPPATVGPPIRGHLQTEFSTLNVIMTFRGGVSDRDVINLNTLYVCILYVCMYILYVRILYILYVCMPYWAKILNNMILCQYIVLLA